jgi:putative ABC transport system permease protein
MVNTLEGALNTLEYEVVGVFRTFSKDYDDRAVRIPLSAAQELLFTRSVHSAVVLLDDTAATDAVTAIIRAKLEPLGYVVKPWHELADFYQKTEALYRRQFGALQSIILVMLVLSVASTINMVVYERTGEFGTLLALGLRRRQIFKLVLLENALLGLLGSLLGVVVGSALAGLISGIGISMPPPPGSNAGYTATIRLVPWVLAMAALTGALAAVMAAVLPARRASRLPVVDALRHNI